MPILFLGLLLPVLVFVFLKFFGRNQFDVPLLYENGVTEIPEGCGRSYPAPYKLPDSVLLRIYPDSLASVLLLVNFGDEPSKLQDIITKFDSELAVVTGKDITMGRSEVEAVRRCVLLLEEPYDMVLIDSEKNIRGHYNGADRDELDRLEAEITIILNKY